MKILYVLPYYPFSLRSGSSVRASNICRSLVRANDVHILCLGLTQATAPHLLDLEASCASISVVPHRFNRAASALKSLFTLTPYDLIIHRNSRFAKELKQRIATIQPDCIYFSRFGSANYVIRGLDIPQVLDQHDLSHAFWRIAATGAAKMWFRLFSRLNYYFSINWEKHLYPKFDAIVSVSQAEMDATKPLVRDNVPIITIPNGADTAYYYPATNSESGKVIVFTGAMNAQRNIDAVVRFVDRIFPDITAKHPETIFRIVGHSPSEAVKRLGKLQNVEVTGEVPDIRPYLEEAAVVIAPFWSGSGVKHKVPIAMAMAKALVLTPNACQGLAIEDRVNAFVAETDKEFAENVLELLESPTKRRELGTNARTFIEDKYSWTSLGMKLSDWLTNEVCSKR